MGGGGGGGGGGVRELDQMATWAVSAVCTVIIVVSILLEMGLHHFGEWLTEKKKKHLYEALEKIKAELMILGFISLLLTFGQKYITQICIPAEVADTMLPCLCRGPESSTAEWKGGAGGHPKPNEGSDSSEGLHRRLLSRVIMDLNSNRRVLSGGGADPSCPPGKVPLVSANGLHQLHIFIFFLAVFHVFGSGCTMALGRAKIRGWKEWEQEAESADFEPANDPQRIRFTHETSFVRQHTSFWNKMKFSFYVVRIHHFSAQYYKGYKQSPIFKGLCLGLSIKTTLHSDLQYA